jgi:hypothetical protein
MKNFTYTQESASEIIISSLDPNKMTKVVYLVEFILSFLFVLLSMGAMAQEKQQTDLHTVINAASITNLKTFTVTQIDNQMHINWVGPVGTKDVTYIIERSSNKVDFSPIGFKSNSNSSTVEVQYSWADSKPIIGLSYYRLKAISADGNITLSSIQVLNMEENIMATTTR